MLCPGTQQPLLSLLSTWLANSISWSIFGLCRNPGPFGLSDQSTLESRSTPTSTDGWMLVLLVWGLQVLEAMEAEEVARVAAIYERDQDKIAEVRPPYRTRPS